MLDIQDEFDPPFEAIEPEACRGPLLFNSPHSGRVYPREFLQTSRLDLATLRRSEDSFVDDLIAGLMPRGYPIMRAHFPRCYVDVNREPYELDPRMFDGRLPSFANTRSMRVAGGLGTVARVVGDAQEIYDQRIPVDDALRRIEGLYKPYHRALRRLMTRIHRDFGTAVLVDCHSMPSTAGPKDERPRADIVIGDRYGTSCVGLVATTSWFIFSKSVNPVAIMRMVYLPGARPGMLYSPLSLVSATFTALFAPETVTVALGTAAPEGSVTTPFRLPGAAAGWAISAPANNASAIVIQTIRVEEIIPYP